MNDLGTSELIRAETVPPSRPLGIDKAMRDAEADNIYWEGSFERGDESDPDSIVYFLYSAGKVRIGTSKQSHRRELAHCSSMPNQARIFMTVNGGKGLEYRLHVRFSADRLHGEWFVLSDYMREVIKDCSPWCYEGLEAAEAQHFQWIRAEAERLGFVG